MEITNCEVILKNFHILTPFLGVKRPKNLFFWGVINVCTCFLVVFGGDHEFLGHFRKFSYFDPFSALFRGQKGPKIDFFQVISVCTHFNKFWILGY